MSAYKPCKLVLTEDSEISTQLVNNLGPVVWLTMLQQTLQNVVAILVLCQLLHGRLKFINNSRHQADCAMLNDKLHQLTAILMQCQLHYLHTEKYRGHSSLVVARLTVVHKVPGSSLTTGSVLITTAMVTRSLRHGLLHRPVVPRSIQPSTLHGTVK